MLIFEMSPRNYVVIGRQHFPRFSFKSKSYLITYDKTNVYLDKRKKTCTKEKYFNVHYRKIYSRI